MKLTAKQREEVVELLRCAADLANMDEGVLITAASRLGISLSSRVFVCACMAWDEVLWAEQRGDIKPISNRDLCLEAAARVEERSWP